MMGKKKLVEAARNSGGRQGPIGGLEARKTFCQQPDTVVRRHKDILPEDNKRFSGDSNPIKSLRKTLRFNWGGTRVKVKENRRSY